VLSEQWALGATNACTPPRAWVPAEAPMRLGDALSGGIGAGRWVAILERLEAGHGGAASVSVQLGGWTATVQRSARQHADRHRRLSDLRLSAEAPDGWQLGRADVHSLAMQLALPQPESAALGVRGVALRWDGGTAQRGLEFVHPRQAQRLWPVQAQRHVVGVCSALAHYRGQRWSGRWQKQSWRQARECLQSQHFNSS
ncbi:MAG: hypothetical protein N2690_10185, partial [Rhodocyclaceae bacterium]|nr:hypothetical protein [Rhodocyclaceae bacterium]